MSEPKQLECLLTQGKITRRDFLTRLSALGITATLSPALLASSVNAATPQKGGRLRLGVAGGSGANLLVCGVFRSASSIAGHYRFYSNHILINRLNPPKTAAAQCCSFQFFRHISPSRNLFSLIGNRHYDTHILRIKH